MKTNLKDFFSLSPQGCFFLFIAIALLIIRLTPRSGLFVEVPLDPKIISPRLVSFSISDKGKDGFVYIKGPSAKFLDQNATITMRNLGERDGMIVRLHGSSYDINHDIRKDTDTVIANGKLMAAIGSRTLMIETTAPLKAELKIFFETNQRAPDLKRTTVVQLKER